VRTGPVCSQRAPGVVLGRGGLPDPEGTHGGRLRVVQARGSVPAGSGATRRRGAALSDVLYVHSE